MITAPYLYCFRVSGLGKWRIKGPSRSYNLLCYERFIIKLRQDGSTFAFPRAKGGSTVGPGDQYHRLSSGIHFIEMCGSHNRVTCYFKFCLATA
jgi:hypothetical protein